MVQRDASSCERSRDEPTAGTGDGRLNRRRLLAALGTGATLGLAGCTGGEGTTPTTAGTPTSAPTATASDTPTDAPATDTPPADAQTVQVRTVPEYGEILVGPDGMSLYMFDRDTQGASDSSCYDDCAAAWPPLIDDAPTAGDGMTATLSTVERRDGSMQVVANGWPLYYYTPDEEPGDVTGQAVGGVWWLLRPDGTVIRDATSTATGTDAQTEEALSSPIELGAETAGWVGRAPAAIEGARNPTLTLQIGREYELTIIGEDSVEHELKIEDDEGEDVVKGEEVERVGERATVRFTADRSLRSYYCDYHPSSMQGRIELVE